MNKFDEYLEMAVNLRDNTALDDDDFVSRIRHEGIKSSSAVLYDNQEDKWRAVADELGMTLAQLGAAAAKLDKPFEGLEGLAVLSGNKALMDMCDYSHPGDTNQFITSMFYGGKRAEQWIRYARNVDADALFDELKQDMDWGAVNTEATSIEGDCGNFVATFNSKKSAKAFAAALELMDKWFDFDIDMDNSGGGAVSLSVEVLQKGE